MRYILNLALILVCLSVRGQQVVDAAGSSSETFDFTLGEIATGENTEIGLGYLHRLTSLAEPNTYVTNDLEVPCSSTGFSIPIESPLPVASGINGLDFCFEYDATVIKPTGTASLGQLVTGGNTTIASYHLNYAQAGKIYGIVYFTGAAPAGATFNGSGEVINLDFTLLPGAAAGTEAKFKICGITEGSTSGVLKDLPAGIESTLKITADYNLTGTITYWNIPAKTLKSGTSFVATSVQGNGPACVPKGNPSLTDENGKFILNVKDITEISITRDIPGSHETGTSCTNVLSFINGADQTLASRIATFDASLVPSVYQVIAADVNLDGRVTAGDVTLLTSRSASVICGFNNNGGGTSREWVFLSASGVNSNPAYAISSAYPADDQSGFSKNRVPRVPLCLPAPAPSANGCISPFTEDYHAILIGDVNGTWSTESGTQLRKDNGEYIALDFLNAVKKDSLYEVPVYFKSHEPVYALDFYLDADTALLKVNEMSNTEATEDFIYQWNKRDKTYFLTSYSMKEIEKEGQGFKMFLNGATVKKLSEKISYGQAFINGREVELQYRDEKNKPREINEVFIRPNPAKDFVIVELPDGKKSIELNLYSQLGIQVAQYKNKENQTVIDLSMLKTGVYTLKVEGSDLNKTFKIVKE